MHCRRNIQEDCVRWVSVSGNRSLCSHTRHIFVSSDSQPCVRKALHHVASKTTSGFEIFFYPNVTSAKEVILGLYFTIKSIRCWIVLSTFVSPFQFWFLFWHHCEICPTLAPRGRYYQFFLICLRWIMLFGGVVCWVLSFLWRVSRCSSDKILMCLKLPCIETLKMRDKCWTTS